MLEPSFRASFGASKLIRYLSDLVNTDYHVAHVHFSERVGRLIDFSGSIALSEAHLRPPRQTDNANPAAQAGSSERFLRGRAAIVKNIIRCFVVPNRQGDGLDIARSPVEESTEKAQDFPPYHAFYVTQQLEMRARVNHLHGELRQLAFQGAAPLAALAALDQALGEAIATRTRQFYAVIPQLLAKRFEQIQQASQAPAGEAVSWSAAGGGFDQFCREMQTVLLAELEIRLQPVLGLTEAMNDAQKEHECS